MAYRSRRPVGAPVNWANPLASGLLFLSPMSEGGGVPIDVVSNLPLTMIGSPVWVSGAFGKGLSLPGSSNLDISTPAMAAASGNYWTWFTQYDFGVLSDGSVLLGYTGTGSNWYIQLEAGGNYLGFSGAPVNGTTAVPISILTDGKPHTLVVTCDNGAITLYIDGNKGGTGSIGGANALDAGQATGKVWHLQGGYAGSFFANGVAGMSGLTARVWSAADVASWNANPNQLLARKPLLYKSAGGAGIAITSGSAGEGESASGTVTEKVAATATAGEGESGSGTVGESIAETGSAGEAQAASGAAGERVAATGTAGEGEAAAGSAIESIAPSGSAGEGESGAGAVAEAIAATGSAGEGEGVIGFTGNPPINITGTAGEAQAGSGVLGESEAAAGSAGQGESAAGAAAESIAAAASAGEAESASGALGESIAAHGTAGEAESASGAATTTQPGAPHAYRSVVFVSPRYVAQTFVSSRYRATIIVS